jgi:hypothetical protein
MDLVEAVGHEGVRHPWETARLRVIERLIAVHAKIPDGSTIVDIGCGDAFVTSAIAARHPSCTVIGIDSGFTSDTLHFDSGEEGTRVKLFRSLPEAASTCRIDSPASLILMLDVLEHVEDPRAFLEEVTASTLFGPATCLVVTVPAYQWLWTGHDAFLRHFRRYTRRQLKECLTDNGLSVERSGYFFASLIPLRTSKVVAERLFGPGVGSDLRPVPGGQLGARFISQLLRADAAIVLALGRVGIVVPGLSVYAICRKSA